ncbi:hypothetical protein BJY21_003396 [Kineosphaera limosa]|uniref:Uncharacterized protein n=1 Tax=Kineosphaera limosa NBRC 100340 TaxID=1184609 RepID=K6WJU6_9MICO|nr:hypothetical protein [Kineosphaera limosa]NYE02212.1 hypothetical protein [Kineosphaera limosa]GAB94066.1 hypothetical protein KILIM_002_00230 [Kineosphaera limosa NBRC 100340]
MAEDKWRPRGATARAVEVDGQPPPNTHYVVTCSGVAYAFEDASWAAFGRDDDACTIVVWECLRSTELSRIAGVLWCMDGDLWVRNLSATHELIVHGDALPVQLPPRTGPRGAACSVGHGGTVGAPSTGAWGIHVSRVSTDDDSHETAATLGTLTLMRPPPALLQTAVAMCEPLLRRGSRPATYSEIGQLTESKPRTARDRVDRLLAYYCDQGIDRLWRGMDREESNYAPLARLLVYRSIVTSTDLALLKPTRASSEIFDAERG